MSVVPLKRVASMHGERFKGREIFTEDPFPSEKFGSGAGSVPDSLDPVSI